MMWDHPSIRNARTAEIVASDITPTPRIQFNNEITPEHSACVITVHNQGSRHSWVGVTFWKDYESAKAHAENLRYCGFDSQAERL